MRRHSPDNIERVKLGQLNVITCHHVTETERVAIFVGIELYPVIACLIFGDAKPWVPQNLARS